jgi:O-antigen/teichoic acid export membrane protein
MREDRAPRPRANWGTPVIALIDQGVVSGASFLTTIMVGRWTSPGQLGLYSVGVSALVASLAIQDSLVSLPYTIQRHQMPRTPAEGAGASLAQSGLLSALVAVLLATTALGLSAGGAKQELTAMTWVLAATAPFALLREFGRRLAFAHMRMGSALMLDSTVAAIQLAALCWLGWVGWMSSASAYAAIGAACAVIGIVWLYLARANFVIRMDQVLATARRNWGLGKWLFAGQATITMQGYVTYWLLAFLVGASATGVYAACMSIVLFANPLIIGIGNTLAPKAALALKQGGRARLRREVIRDSLLLGAAMAVFCLLVLLAGESAMRALYRGDEYAGRGQILMPLALAMMASAVDAPASIGLASMERPQAIVWAGSIGVVLTIVLVWRLTIEWGLFGAACGFLAGYVAAALGRWVAFLLLVVPRGPQPDLEEGAAAWPSEGGMEFEGLVSSKAIAPSKQWLEKSS